MVSQLPDENPQSRPVAQERPEPNWFTHGPLSMFGHLCCFLGPAPPQYPVRVLDPSRGSCAPAFTRFARRRKCSCALNRFASCFGHHPCSQQALRDLNPECVVAQSLESSWGRGDHLPAPFQLGFAGSVWGDAPRRGATHAPSFLSGDRLPTVSGSGPAISVQLSLPICASHTWETGTPQQQARLSGCPFEAQCSRVQILSKPDPCH